MAITIDGTWQDQPLAAMVFQWFFQFWGPIVHDGYWKGAFYNAFFLQKNEIRVTKCSLIKMSKTETHCA